MKNEIEDNIRKGFDTAFINAYSDSNLAYRPEFICNDYSKGEKVLSTIENELKNCQEFYISVAFITMGGIEPLLQTLKDLEHRNIPGKILTTNYLVFNDPKALKKLAELKNIEIRMYYVNQGDPGFHTKGYWFKQDEIYKILIGSSNLTQSAITKNKEWNTKIVATKNGEYTKNIISEFDALWEHSVSLDECIDTYTKIYNEQKRIARQEVIPRFEQFELKPNSMQVAFINNLEKMIENGAKKSLLISSTGTGKTFASAFAVRDVQPKKALFLVHREQILDQTMKSYRDVLGSKNSFGKLSGTAKDFDSDFLFSTMSMMAKTEIQLRYKPEEFEMIVIDEVHRAGSKSYQIIMEYFKPKLWLGMTASPDRPDGFDIYKLFDNNIAYEIRLQQALEEDLLCPFHYFGITDLVVDDGLVSEEDRLKEFNLLIREDRVSYIIEKTKYFGYSGDRVKGLVFCSSIEESTQLSIQFNNHGYETVSLSGNNSIAEREEAIDKLVSDDLKNKLDYIFTVDVFNEGVDVPQLNQIIMLRPTQSPIIFIQQLGRGLRKFRDKEFVVILDFIGNYTNNFMIPLALSGDRSRSKDVLRKYVAEGNRIIPGCSSIHFDSITKERIYKSISKSNLNKVADIKFEYSCLRNKLGKIPTYMDFENYNTIDLSCIFDNSSLGSYHIFLKKYEPDYEYKNELNETQEQMLAFVSQNLAKGKRPDELLLLKNIIDQTSYSEKDYILDLKQYYKNSRNVSKNELRNVIKVLMNDFLPNVKQKKKFEKCVFVTKDGDNIEKTGVFINALKNNVFKQMVLELIEYGLYRNQKKYSELYNDTEFVLYQKYTKSDVCRLLNWDKNQNPQNVGGYFYDKKTHTLPVFVTYRKDENVVESQNYEDRFESPVDFISISKANRNLSSPEMNYFYADDTKIYLFIKKNSTDTISEYYFMGQLFIKDDKKQVERDTIGDTVLEFKYRLEKSVREDIYQYFSQDYIPVDE